MRNLPVSPRARAALALAAALCAPAAGADAPPVRFKGKVWTEAGQISRVSDTISSRVDGNRLQGMGAQVVAEVELGEHLEAAIGIGAMQVYHGLGNSGPIAAATEYNTLGVFRNYLPEARLTWYDGPREDPSLSLTLGHFIYDYNPHVRNLGLYLLRGPVYPGFVMGGFGNVHTDDSRANLVGARVHQTLEFGPGRFEHDLLLIQEREVPPNLDWSLAYVARYKAFGWLEAGAGANFYRLLPANSELTKLSRKNFANLYGYDSTTMSSGDYHPYDLRYIEVMPGGDTVFYTHQGMKLMAMVSADLKPLLGRPKWAGPNGLEVYSEVAVIGVKDYGSVYDNILERIPVMFGINLPTFGLLDLFAVEAEWYGARYRADYSKLGLFNSLNNRGIVATVPNRQPELPSPIPVSYADYDINDTGTTQQGQNVRGTPMDFQNMVTDNWKWSVYAEKIVNRRVRFTAQIANDHFVPRPTRSVTIAESGGLTEAFSDLTDFYFMFSAGYSF